MANQIEYIKDSDLLFQGTRKINEFAIDPANRAETKSENAIQISNNAKEIAETAEGNSVETQIQLENIVIESGTSDAETLASRGEFNWLPNRLKNSDDILSETSGKLDVSLNQILVNFGQINLFGMFANLPFAITRLGKRRYKHSVTPSNVYDWRNATEIFISSKATDGGAGTSSRLPVSFGRFTTNLKAGLYGAQKDFIITVLSGTYEINNPLNLAGLDINLYVRSGSLSGKTWFGGFSHIDTETPTMSAWIDESGLKKTTVVTNMPVVDIVNQVDLDDYGAPKVYEKVLTLAECQLKKGTFYHAGNSVFVNRYTGSDINDCMPQIIQKSIDTTGWTGKMLILENLCFTTSAAVFNFNDLNQNMYQFNCLYYRGEQDSFGVTGKFNVFSFNVVAAYASKDAFNYHSSSPDSRAFEFGCVGYGSGQYKLTTPNSNTDKNSNNGSTAHDSMNVLRIMCKYFNCEGPIVADINGCESINLGIEVGNILPSFPGIDFSKSAFSMNNIDEVVSGKKQYVYECFANGSNVKNGLNGTNKTYYSDLEGNLNTVGSVNRVIWEEVNT